MHIAKIGIVLKFLDLLNGLPIFGHFEGLNKTISAWP